MCRPTMYTSTVFLLASFVICPNYFVDTLSEEEEKPGSGGLDSQEIKTVFVQDPFRFTVVEDAPLSTIVGRIKTSRPVSRLLLFGNDAFVIDEISGNILTARRLDYEKRQSYNLLVQADSIDSKTGSASVIISITDRNEAPRFLQTNYDVTVSRQFPVGGEAITISAVDQDGGPAGALLYGIQSLSSSPYLAINSVSGKVFTRRSLSPGTLTVSIEAVDMGFPRLSTTALIRLHVIDDGVTIIPDSTSTCANTSLDIMVTENVSPGTMISLLNDKLPVGKNYLINGAFGRFSLSTDNNLVVNGHLDFETQKFYDLLISPEDNPQYSIINVRISIIDVNDFPPMFFGLLSPFRIPSNFPLGKTVYGVKAWDGDQPGTANSFVSYSLVSASETFSVDSTSGDITLKKNLESQRTYALRIMGSDKETPSLQGYTDLEIDTFSPTLGFPIFESGFVTISLPEQRPIGTHVYTASATSSRAGPLLYNIIGQTGETMFYINSTTGVIITQVVFSRDSTERTALVVRATTQEDNSLNTDMMVYIEISDINNHRPVFPFRCLSVYISRKILPGAIVYRPLATDKDISSTLRYNITDGNQDDTFDISDGATIRVKKPLDKQRNNVFNLTIRVSDSIHSDTTQLIVNLE